MLFPTDYRMPYPALTPEQRAAVAERCVAYTMVPGALPLTIGAVEHALRMGVPGGFVECGVWRGGAAAAMRLAQEALAPAERRTLHLFDSFEGLPPAQAVDGPLALRWQADTNGPMYHDNARAPLDEVVRNLAGLGISEDVAFHPGWFAQTIPGWAKGRPQIAVLRLDGDWYESTKVALEWLYPLVADRGVIVIDDYYAWDGCARAVHEYLGARGLNHRIRSGPDYHGAFILSEPHRRG